MKNLIIGIVIAALLIGGIAGASVLYKNLSDQVDAGSGPVEFIPNSSVVGGNTQPVSSDSSNGAEQATEPNTEQATEQNTEQSVEQSTESFTEHITEHVTTPVTEQITEEITEVPTDELGWVFLEYDFTVLDMDGNYVKLSDFAGKPIVLNFWGTWCPYCVQEMPHFDKAYEEFPDVQFLMINCGDTVAKAKNYVASEKFGFDVFFDTMEQAQSTYGVYSFPTTFFITSDGSKIYYYEGMINYNTLVDAINTIRE